MSIETILIINKSGGLIYHKNFSKKSSKLTLNSNDYLILASTLHSVFAISSQITPKALQTSQSNLNYTIPYHPYVGVTSSSNSNSNNLSKQKKFGSFKGDDFFKEPFISWNKSGLRQLSTDQFTMYIYQTLTGLKFVAISSTVIPQNTLVNNNTTNAITAERASHSQYNVGSQIADNFLRKIYCIYSDYVMKDPFYSLEMPIKSELFDKNVTMLVNNMI